MQQQAHSQDFIQEEANLALAQGTPYQKLKTPQIWPTVFWVWANLFLFSYFYFIFFIFPAQGAIAPALPPG